MIAAILAAACAGCATTSSLPGDATAPAIAVARSFQGALASRDFARAMSLVSADFTSAAWPRAADLQIYFDQARERAYFDPATVAPEPLNATRDGGTVQVYPVGVRARAGVTVFKLALAPRSGEWKIVGASVEFY
jgi:hypothetical protein